ncbi:MAG: heavy metal translocating P-type ATPase [Microthrixaceae bacterium]
MTPDGGAWHAVAFTAGVIGVLVAGWSVVRTARARRVGADLLALLALVGALVIDEPAAAAVVTLMLVSGMVLDARASRRAGRDLSLLVDRQPRTARRRAADGIESVPVERVAAGDVLVIASGDIVPVDGTVDDTGAATVDGSGADLDESALTGEPLPRHAAAGGEVPSGSINAGAPFDLRATATAADSTYAGIVEIARRASAATAPMVRLADRLAVGFLGVGVALAAVAWVATGELERAVAVLVVATPCPLILAVPIAVTSGLSRAARRGVVVRGGGTLERLGQVDTVFLDKTGTITAGRPEVTSVITADGIGDDELLTLAAAVDQGSSHVVAAALHRAAADRGLALPVARDLDEAPGAGVTGTVDGRTVRVGGPGWIDDDDPICERATRLAARLDGIVVLVEIDGSTAGGIVLADRPRPEAARTIRRLRRAGVEHIVLLTGDGAAPAGAVGALVGLEHIRSGATPANKLDAIVSARAAGGVAAMVGDGINDAPALAAADAGIGVALSVAAMVAAAFGFLPPIWGAVTQEVIDVAVILNAVRAATDPRRREALGDDDADVMRHFGGEHDRLRPQLDLLLRLADALTLPDADTESARRALRVLREELLPHEVAEAHELYPDSTRSSTATSPQP